MCIRDRIKEEPRRIVKRYGSRDRRSRIIGETFPPPFARSSIIKMCIRDSSYVTLFTKSPSFPKRANAYLKDKFGTPYEDAPSINSLHTSMFANSYNTYMKKYSFKLLNNPVAKTILIGVFDLNTKELLDCSVGYTYQDIQKALTKKLKNLLYVTCLLYTSISCPAPRSP